MKERPILFSGPMVRAILDGRKTQTRRLVKHIPMLGEPKAWCATAKAQEPGWVHIVGDYTRFCPHGQPGTHLWVRETFCCKMGVDGYIYKNGKQECYYRATENKQITKDDGNGGTEYRQNGVEASPWSPSIFMPRWASRITLEITDVRVERLQCIGESDAMAEGIPLPNEQSQFSGAWWTNYDGIGHSTQSGILVFSHLWDSINAKRCPWESNPWVWAITFRRITR